MRKSKQLLVICLAIFISSYATANEFYRVSNVQKNDSLSMRKLPSAKSIELANIPYNTVAISGTGRKNNAGKSIWVEVYFDGQKGWVNKSYLTRTEGVSFKEKLFCVYTEPFYSIDVISGELILRDMSENETHFIVTDIHQSLNHTNEWVVSAKSSKDGNVIMFVQEGNCSDDMSDFIYSYKTIFHYGNKNLTLSGCGNRKKE